VISRAIGDVVNSVFRLRSLTASTHIRWAAFKKPSDARVPDRADFISNPLKCNGRWASPVKRSRRAFFHIATEFGGLCAQRAAYGRAAIIH